MPALLTLTQIHACGTPAELGRAQGEQLKPLIGAFVAQRLRAAKVYLHERGIRDEQTFRDLGRRCLDALKSWDPDGWVEHMALAEAAGIDAVDLYTTGNMTDIRDILALPAVADAEGCTTALLPGSHTADGVVIAAQTWDLNPTDLEFVVAVHRQPSNGPETWSVTCAGCPTLVGMNAHGVAVGTTNIKTRASGSRTCLYCTEQSAVAIALALSPPSSTLREQQPIPTGLPMRVVSMTSNAPPLATWSATVTDHSAALITARIPHTPNVKVKPPPPRRKRDSRASTLGSHAVVKPSPR
jgi:hypothetical protein